MGSIASVLQWHCTKCSLINPTERFSCARCGTIREGENEWKLCNGDVKQSDRFRGAKNNSPGASPPFPEKGLVDTFATENGAVNKRKSVQRKCFTWGANSSYKKITRSRSVSISVLTRQWCCSRCSFFNVTVCSSCVRCGVRIDNNDRKDTLKEENLCSVAMDSYNPNWFSEESSVSHASSKKSDAVSPVDISQSGVNMTSVIDRNKGISQTLNRSPKRQSPSVYERVKTKVSRSLSNGSVVQKLWMENTAKATFFKRPTSLLVNTGSSQQINVDFKKNFKDGSGVCDIYTDANKDNRKSPELAKDTWTCPRCTLQNSVSLTHCEICETLCKTSMTGNTLPRNGIVITIPEWNNGDTDLSKPKSKVYKSFRGNQTSNKAKSSVTNSQCVKGGSQLTFSQSPPQECNKDSHCRRCCSEVNTTNPEELALKKTLMSRSMVETDGQNNLLIKSPVNNVNSHSPVLNAPKTTRLRYSSAGLTDMVCKKNDASGYDTDAYEVSKNNPDLKEAGLLRKRLLPMLPVDVSISSRDCSDLETTISCTVSSPYHPNNSSQKSLESSVTVSDSEKKPPSERHLKVSPYEKVWQSNEKSFNIVNVADRNIHDCAWQQPLELASDSVCSKTNSKGSYDTLWGNLDANSGNQSNNKSSKNVHYEKVWQKSSVTSDSSCEGSSDISNLEMTCKGSKLNQLDRMWTCIKCSFAYNPIWSNCCDICYSVRTPPSLTEPSLITVTKDSVRYTPSKASSSYMKSGNHKNRTANDYKIDWSSSSGLATLAAAEQDLEDDFQILATEESSLQTDHADNGEDWTCKKCTLVSCL